MFESLWSHDLQQNQASCPSPSHRVCQSSCPLNWWCHPAISSSVVLFSFCFQSCPASGSFPTSRLFESGGQSIGASASVLQMSVQDWFSLRLTGLISFLSQGLSRVFSSAIVQKHQFFVTLPSLWSSAHICFIPTLNKYFLSIYCVPRTELAPSHWIT